jgi:hypothetical protein
MKEQRLSEIATWKVREWSAEQPDPALEEDYGPFSERQSANFWFQVGLTQGLGKYTQDFGPEGAHYVDSAANPFIDEGLVCGNCAFFESDSVCEIVDGGIDPQGLCKLWVIPEGMIGPVGPDGLSPEQTQQKAEWKKKKPKKKKY